MPRLDDRTKEKILSLRFPSNGFPSLNGREIYLRLIEENEAGETYTIPVDQRAVQKLIKRVRDRMTEDMRLDLQPWNIIANAKAGLPFAPVLLCVLKTWLRLKRASVPEEWLVRPFPIGVARWIVRLHQIGPDLSEEELVYWAPRCFDRERHALLEDEYHKSTGDDVGAAFFDESNEQMQEDLANRCYSQDQDLQDSPLPNGEYIVARGHGSGTGLMREASHEESEEHHASC